jgi:hypothetical protein
VARELIRLVIRVSRMLRSNSCVVYTIPMFSWRGGWALAHIWETESLVLSLFASERLSWEMYKIQLFNNLLVYSYWDFALFHLFMLSRKPS